jgi:hypothetical protein
MGGAGRVVDDLGRERRGSVSGLGTLWVGRVERGVELLHLMTQAYLYA